jgi:hypothetical protein
MLMVFPLELAIIHEAVGVPSESVGLEVEPVLSLPTTLTV